MIVNCLWVDLWIKLRNWVKRKTTRSAWRRSILKWLGILKWPIWNGLEHFNSLSKSSKMNSNKSVLCFLIFSTILFGAVQGLSKLRKCCSTDQVFDVKSKACVDNGVDGDSDDRPETPGNAGSQQLLPELMLNLGDQEKQVNNPFITFAFLNWSTIQQTIGTQRQ